MDWITEAGLKYYGRGGDRSTSSYYFWSLSPWRQLKMVFLELIAYSENYPGRSK